MCGKILKGMLGVHCANYSTLHVLGGPVSRHGVGSVTLPLPQDRFFHFQPSDEAGFNWHPLEDTLSFRIAYDGIHLLVSFQCDLCWFRNLHQHNPIDDAPANQFPLCIHRANLNAVWGRETLTVQATLWGAVQMVSIWTLTQTPIALPSRRPYPVSDSFGMRVAIAMLVKSLEPGRYSKMQQQFETFCKSRASYANMHMSSLDGSEALWMVGGDTAKLYLTQLPTNSLWFERFALGCLHRMGQDVRQDWAITLHAMHGLMDTLEREWTKAGFQEQHQHAALAGAFAIIVFCGSFQGNEVFLTDLYGLNIHLGELESRDHVIIPLLGKYKGELHHRYHLTPMLATTDHFWLERLVRVQHEVGVRHGSAFSDVSGQISSPCFIESVIAERLQQVGIPNQV